MIPVHYAKAADYSVCGAALEKVIGAQLAERGGVHGKSVMLKPNLLAWRRAEDPACVHPEILLETARIFHDAGAARIAILENPAVQTAPSIVHAMGIAPGLRKLGVTVANFSDYRGLEPPEGVRFHDLEIAAEYLGFDEVADIAKAKTHAMMTLTLCVKNLFGFVNGSARLGWHLAVGRDFERFADMLLDLYLTIRPGYNILDAVVCMEGNGPGSGSPAERGFVAGSTDSLALDASVAELLGVPDLLILANAAKRGILPEFENAGEIPECPPLALPDPPGLMMQWGLRLPPGLRELLRKSMLSRPVADESKCVGCGVCVRMCPPHSLKLRNGKPHFRLDECIRCYCCQEHCPKGAIRPRKTVAMRTAEFFEKRIRSCFRNRP